ncbi:MAG: hypothetical protein J6X49_05410 [Victivallales bacterium]|nr:hypothetical protein [Victivallales bacterium]
MSKNRILLVAFLMAGLATVAVAKTFSVDLYLDNGVAKSLTFGMGASRELAGVPPFQAPANLNVVWLEGPGDVTEAKIDEDFSKLSTYIKEDAKAGVWKLYVRNAMKITFKSANIPSGAYLKLSVEDGEDEAIDIVNETVVNATADTTYLIDYRETSSTTVALPCPPVKKVQMSSAMNSLPIDFDIPDGYALAADSAVKAFKAEVEEDDLGEYTVFTELDGNYGTFNAAAATLNMTNMTNVARIQFEYWFKKGTDSTEKAVVIVDVTKGLMTTLVKKQDAATGDLIGGAVVAVDPGVDGYDGTILTYKIDFDDASAGKKLDITVSTPKFAPTAEAYSVQYCFTNEEDGEGQYADLPGSYDVAASSIYLKVKATLTDKCEPGYVTPTIAIGDNTVELEPVQFILVSGGTMDIDGNGAITEDDAIMMYNFIALGGIDDPESMFVEDIIQGIDETQVNAEAALATLQSLAAFLDYDENGVITEDDAIMMYNFIALGGIDDPESMFVEDIIQGIDETQVNAEKALENFKKYASK